MLSLHCFVHDLNATKLKFYSEDDYVQLYRLSKRLSLSRLNTHPHNHYPDYLPSYEMTPRFILVTFYRSIQNFNIPTGKKI